MLVIELYNQGKTFCQIIDVVHMRFKDVWYMIKKHNGEDGDSVDGAGKSKDARAFGLFLHGKQSVEVAIELICLQMKWKNCMFDWRLSKLDNLEIQYHEAEYSFHYFCGSIIY